MKQTKRLNMALLCQCSQAFMAKFCTSHGEKTYPDTLQICLPCKHLHETPQLIRFWEPLQSLAPAMRKAVGTSKNVAGMLVFLRWFHFMCFAPRLRVRFGHFNFQKCSVNDILDTFDFQTCYPQLCAILHISFSVTPLLLGYLLQFSIIKSEDEFSNFLQ